jgi:DNA-binding FrmR family transcriptional regulator
MELNDELHKAILTRLRRAEGQVRGVQSMIEDGRDCAEVVAQFAAAIRAVEQAAYKYFAATVQQCAVHPDEAAASGYTTDRLEKLFMQLA